MGKDMALVWLFLCITIMAVSGSIEIRLNIDISGAESCSTVSVNVNGKDNKPRDCVEARQYNSTSGVVTIYPADNTPLQVYCDHHTDGGGWLVFQRRQDGSVDFYRNWTEYQQGFGDLNGEFWLGLDALHMLTSSQTYELRVDLTKFDGTEGYATYSNFSISNSSDNYRLHFDSFTGGNAGDSLALHNDKQFTTYDADHDTKSGVNCAVRDHGAWWYDHCHDANLNAYYVGNGSVGWDRVVWYTFDGYVGLNFTEMKLRRTNATGAH